MSEEKSDNNGVSPPLNAKGNNEEEGRFIFNNYFLGFHLFFILS